MRLAHYTCPACSHVEDAEYQATWNHWCIPCYTTENRCSSMVPEFTYVQCAGYRLIVECEDWS